MGKNISSIKSTTLRKCMNPKCPYFYYGHKGNRYCTPKCAMQAHNIKCKDIRIKWNKEHPERIRQYTQKQRERRKNNPELHEKYLKYQREYRQRLKSDPEKYKKYLEKQRINNKKNYHKNKNKRT